MCIMIYRFFASEISLFKLVCIIVLVMIDQAPDTRIILATTAITSSTASYSSGKIYLPICFEIVNSGGR